MADRFKIKAHLQIMNNNKIDKFFCVFEKLIRQIQWDIMKYIINLMNNKLTLKWSARCSQLCYLVLLVHLQN